MRSPGKMPEKLCLRDPRRNAIKLTTTRIIVVKPSPKRRARTSHILYTTDSTIHQIYHIRRITINGKIYLIFLIGAMGSKSLTVTHTRTNLTSRLTTRSTSPCTTTTLPATMQLSSYQNIPKVLAKLKGNKWWFRKHPSMFL